MTNFYTEHGILLETTCPHTPQQNGVVERKHRHLLETARALKFEAKLPSRFWGECVLIAAYIINRLPSKSIENKTPFEIIFNEKADYDHMKVFGCLAYYRSTETDGDKLEERGKPGVFLGHPPGTKGYKIFDTRKNKIIISRDVKFFENIFPYESIKAFEHEQGREMFTFPPWYYDNEQNQVLHQNGSQEPPGCEETVARPMKTTYMRVATCMRMMSSCKKIATWIMAKKQAKKTRPMNRSPAFSMKRRCQLEKRENGSGPGDSTGMMLNFHHPSIPIYSLPIKALRRYTLWLIISLMKNFQTHIKLFSRPLIKTMSRKHLIKLYRTRIGEKP
ncbi:putative RNA-directed DNA polymerase [Helianthus annuus]|nr:putative RNA-directed DNA polymerase [Helianthus annuus]